MRKRHLIVLCIALLLIFLPQIVQAADDYTYIDQNGDIKTTEGLTVAPILAETSSLSSGWYVVNSNVTCSTTMSISGNVNIILADGYILTITGSNDNAGINVLPGNSLTIFGQAGGTGTLYAQGGINGAGIGGRKNSSAGNITINSGTVTAIGGNHGAGIGGGYYGNGGTINIAGGTVSATGGMAGMDYGGTKLYTGAGIGGGYEGTGGVITISGGTVIATSGQTDRAAGAGIGGGSGKDGGRITISGGTVTARSTQEGAGIGGGYYGTGGIIVISGGDITASSHYRGAGIGGGDMKDGGSITIQNGTVNAYSEYGGTGIGGGYLASGGTITIQGGDITAKGGSWGAGIGSGGQYNAGNITITGGVVKAYAGDYNTGVYSGSAGIGAGGINSSNTHTGGNIKILGGNVTAVGSYSSLDIGRGRSGVNGTLLIDDTAQVTLGSKGIDASTATLGTCIIQGPATGSLLGAYEGGAKIDGTLIDVSSSALSSGADYTVSGNTISLSGSGSSYILFGSTTSRNVIISSGISANVTLFTADIEPASGCAFDMTGATVNMRLVSANTLSSSSGCAGLQAAADSALTINGSGRLTATGGNNGAGIGGGNGASSGSITFLGGTVSAAGSGGGAGIGGGSGGSGGAVLADGENAIISATGGETGYDIGSGSGSLVGGSLSVNNKANITLNRNGTNAVTNYITCTIGGEGAGLSAGTYLNSQKLLSFSGVAVSPNAGADALSTVTLSVVTEGLSDVIPEGYISFKANGIEIGQCAIVRTGAGNSGGTASIEWTPLGGTYTLTAHYMQDQASDSYYTTGSAVIKTGYTVSKIEQTALKIGAPGTITYKEAPFNLLVTGGSGTGSLSYRLITGDAVSVNSNGQVTVKRAGVATVSVTKAADNNYKEASATLEITVNKAAPAAVVFPVSSNITYCAELSSSVLSGGSGDGSFAWESPSTIPTVNNSGYNVIFTPNDADNYDYSSFTLKRVVGISVSKATPVVTFPTAQPIIYGSRLSSSVLTSGSGDGSFAWENPNIVLPVINSGYNVIFTPTDIGNYLTVQQVVNISVNKADQEALLFAGIPDDIRYGDLDFFIHAGGGSGTGDLMYQVTSGDAITVDTAGKVSVNRPGTALLTVTKAGDSNYNARQDSIQIIVNKADQTRLSLLGIPGVIRSGDADFSVQVSSGSGTGELKYEVTSGNSVSVTAAGNVSVKKEGVSILTITKAGDAFYNEASVSVELRVNKRAVSDGSTHNSETVIAPTPSPSAIASSAPSTMPSQEAVPPPEPSQEAAVLAPSRVENDAETGVISIEISIVDLPENTTAIRLASGEVINVDRTQALLRLKISHDDLNVRGELEVIALNEKIPLSSLRISVVDGKAQTPKTASETVSVFIWLAAGIGVFGLGTVAVVTALKKRGHRF